MDPSEIEALRAENARLLAELSLLTLGGGRGARGGAAIEALLDASEVAVLRVDLSGLVHAANQSARSLFGIRTQRAPLGNLREWFSSQATAGILAWGAQCLQLGRGVRFADDEFPARREFEVHPLLDDERTQVFALFVHQTSEARRLQRQLHELFEGVDLIATVLDTSGRIVLANHFLADLTGHAIRDIEGRIWFDLFLPDDVRETVRHLYQRTILSGELPKRFENDIVTAHGERRTIRWSNTTLRDPSDQVIGVASLGEDITERRREQDALLRSRERLRALATQLSTVEDRERRRLASLLHDDLSQELLVLRLKLTAILADAGEPLRAQLEEVQERLGQSIDHARRLTYDLSPPVLYELGLEPALESEGYRIAREHGLQFDFEVRGSGEPLVDELGPVFFRAVRELLMNVVKHASATRVRVEIRRDFPFIAVVVEDDGIGFDPERKRSVDPSEGGFGLFSIRERLRQLGGTLEIGSSPMGGAVVILTCPLAPQDSRDEGRGDVAAGGADGTH